MNKAELRAAMAHLGTRRWKKFVRQNGRAALRKRMSEIGKLGGRPRKLDTSTAS